MTPGPVRLKLRSVTRRLLDRQPGNESKVLNLWWDRNLMTWCRLFRLRAGPSGSYEQKLFTANPAMIIRPLLGSLFRTPLHARGPARTLLTLLIFIDYAWKQTAPLQLLVARANPASTACMELMAAIVSAEKQL